MSKLSRRIERANLKTVPEPEITQVDLPEIVESGDYWQWQAMANAMRRLEQEIRGAQAELRQLEPEYRKLTDRISQKYSLGPKDAIDPQTLKIIRASEAPPAPAATDDQ